MSDEITSSSTPFRSKWLGYNQAVCLLIIGVACLVMLFFRADELLGAARLKAVYKDGGFLTAYVALVGIPMMFALWGNISWGAAIGFCVLITLGGLFVGSYLILLGWILLLGLPVLPTIFLVGILVITSLSIFVLPIMCQELPVTLVKSVTLIALFWTAMSLISAASDPSNSESTYYGSISLEEHRYFLYLRWGWLGEPDWFELYECNAIGIGCLQIAPYDNVNGLYLDGDIALVADPAQHEVRILFNGDVVFTHRPDED